MRKAIVSRYQAVWIIRGSLPGIVITYLHLLRVALYRRLLSVPPCPRLLLVSGRPPPYLHAIAAPEQFSCLTISLKTLSFSHLKYSKVLLQLDEKQYSWGQM